MARQGLQLRESVEATELLAEVHAKTGNKGPSSAPHSELNGHPWRGTDPLGTTVTGHPAFSEMLPKPCAYRGSWKGRCARAPDQLRFSLPDTMAGVRLGDGESAGFAGPRALLGLW